MRIAVDRMRRKALAEGRMLSEEEPSPRARLLINDEQPNQQQQPMLLLQDEPSIISSQSLVSATDSGDDEESLIRDEVLIMMDDMIAAIEAQAESVSSSGQNQTSVTEPVSVPDRIVFDADMVTGVVSALLQEMVELVERQHILAYEMNFELLFAQLPNNDGPISPGGRDNMSEISLSSSQTPKTQRTVKSVRFQPAEGEEQVEEDDSHDDEISQQISQELAMVPTPSAAIVATVPSAGAGGTISKYGVSTPQLPKPFQIGIRNPSDLRWDANYWQNKDIRELTAAERMELKLAKIPKLREHYQMLKYGKVFVQGKRQVSELRLLKDEVTEDFLEAIEPLMMQYQALMLRARPYILRYRSDLQDILRSLLSFVRSSLQLGKLKWKPQLRKALDRLEVIAQQEVRLSPRPVVNENEEKQVGVDDVRSDTGYADEVLAVMEELLDAIANRDETAPTSAPAEATVEPAAVVDPSSALPNVPEVTTGAPEAITQEGAPDGDDQQSSTKPADESTAASADDEGDEDEEEEEEEEDNAEPDDEQEQEVEAGEVAVAVPVAEKSVAREPDEESIESKSASTKTPIDVPNAPQEQAVPEDPAVLDEGSVQEVSAEESSVVTATTDEETAMNRRQNQRFVQAILRGGDWETNPMQADLTFWNDIIVQDLFDKAIVDVLRNLCERTEERINEEIKKQEELDAKRLFGCEISVIIRVNQEQRDAVPGLHDLSSIDIAEYVKRQLFNPKSELNEKANNLTNAIVDISFTSMYQPKGVFDQWSAYWVHMVHPSFFHYSAQKKHKKLVDEDSISMMSKSLPPGLKLVNPVALFDERTKQAFQALQQRPTLHPPGYHAKRTDDLEEPAPADSSVSVSGVLLDLSGDEFAKEFKDKLSIYRPNMEKLTPKEVERSLRVYKEFKAQYEKEMLPGLLNNSLRPSQYNALKDLESAYRIYRTAKQRYEFMLRKNMDEDDIDEYNRVIPLHITNIELAQYEQWLDEVRDEDRQRLIAYRANAAKVREQLKHEAKLRREAEQTKTWLMEAFVKYYGERRPVEGQGNDNQSEGESQATSMFSVAYPSIALLYDTYYDYVHDSLELDQALRRELDKPLDAPTTQSPLIPVTPGGHGSQVALTAGDIITLRKKTKISEEKKTRRLFAFLQGLDVIKGADGQLTVSMTSSRAQNQMEVEPSSIDVATFIIDGLLESIDSIEDTNGLADDLFITKDKLLNFIDFASSALQQMDNVKNTMQYALHRAATPKDGKRTRRAIKQGTFSQSTSSLPGLNTSPPRSPSSGSTTARPSTSLMRQGTTNTMESADESVSNEADEEHDFFLLTIDNYDQLSREDWQLLRELQWLRAIREHPPFFDCLKHMPSLQAKQFMKDELVQFASLLVELYAVFRQVMSGLNQSKLEAEMALGINKKGKKKTKKRHRGAGRIGQAHEEEEEEPVESTAAKLQREDEEAAKKLNDVRKAAERDKAWFMAHPHRFLRPLDNLKGPPFCIVCLQKAHEYWLKQREQEERTWKQGMAVRMEEALDTAENQLRSEIEGELREALEMEARTLITETMKAEGLKLSSIDEDSESNAPDTQEQPNFLASLSAADEEILKWEQDMAKIVKYIVRSHLSLVDARGNTILPSKPVKKMLVSISDGTSVINSGPSTVDYELEDEPAALKICVFHRNDQGERSKFLGMVELSEKELRKPPKGIRVYHLKADSGVVDEDPVAIAGQLALTLSYHHKPSNQPNKPDKQRWKLQLKKLSKLHAMNAADLTNPYCEIFWKGPAQKDGMTVNLREWTITGQTKTKTRAVEVVYNQKEEQDNSVFDLPAVWTTANIPQRGLRESDIVFGGGYVARNQIPSDEVGSGDVMTKSGKKFTFGVQASVEEIIQYRSHMKYKELLAVEVKLKSEALKLIRFAEERERLCMSEEERLQRDVRWQVVSKSYAPSLVVQESFAKDFQRLLEGIVHPSSLLNRLRFVMGEDNVEVSFPRYPHLSKKNSSLKGTPNSLVVRCQDCSTKEVLRVICTPILYPEDEENMRNQAFGFVGKLSRHNLKIMDFAVHDVTVHDSIGFRAIHERMAVVITENVEGPTLMDHLWEHWEEIEEKEFLQWMLQIVSALQEIHAMGILHRNFSPHCVQLQFPSGNKAFDGVTVRLGGYWFLENPREAGCDRSQGRADWGYLLTTPPELSSVPKPSKLPRPAPIQTVTDRSDIYAFGVCVFYWVTKGQLLPADRYFMQNIDILRPHLPTKWGGWLLSLLRMCLVMDPSCRASAKDVIVFLRRHGAK